MSLLPALRHPVAASLREFVALLEARGLLRRLATPISVEHELTEIHRRVLAANGPALLIENPRLADGTPARMPVLVNLFGTLERIALGLGLDRADLPALGEALAELRFPRPPRDLKGAWAQRDMLRAALSLRTRPARRRLARSSCAPAPTSTSRACPSSGAGRASRRRSSPGRWLSPPRRRPHDINVGVYRMQVLGPDRAILRWLPSRGGARHHRLWRQQGRDMPVAIAIGADPATILAAVMPLPDGMNEMAFAGVPRRRPTVVARAVSVDSAGAGRGRAGHRGHGVGHRTAPEGPYGDTPATSTRSSRFR